MKLKNKKEIVLKTVSKNGLALQLASKEIQNDKEVVLKAVSDIGCALEFKIP